MADQPSAHDMNLMDLDRTDVAILDLLQQAGQMSNIAIGEKLNVSHSTVARRIAALERSGVIARYQAVLDRALLGLGETILVMVQLKAHGDGATAEFENEINAGFPNVIESFKLSGSWDYILKVAASNMAHYDEIHTKLALMKQVKLLRSFPVIALVTAPVPIK